MKHLWGSLLLTASLCWSQSEFTISLPQANSALSLPSMAERGGVLYAAYRSFDLFRFSNQLQIVAYDLTTRKELRRAAIALPKVHGARASDGLFLSEDGQVLAYAELHDPGLILLLSAKNLTEIRRSVSLPFTSQDHQRLFAGFDHGQLCIASSVYDSSKPNSSALRFVRLGISDLTPFSETTAIGVSLEASQAIIWLPQAQRTWVNPPVSLASDIWTEYTESGSKTGNLLEHPHAVSNGAVALEPGTLIAFYGNMLAKGAIICYADHRQQELELPCAAHPYGRSSETSFVGALCTSERDILPEAGGTKMQSSQFLLVETDGPKVIWQHQMPFLGVSNAPDPGSGFQKGDPLICSVGSKIMIVVPSKAGLLTVYEIDSRHPHPG